MAAAAMQAASEAVERGAPPAHRALEDARRELCLWREVRRQAGEAAAARLNATRLSVLELLFDTELTLGQHSTIIPELTALVRAESLNERLCELLMVALYRSGRQTDALSVYRVTARRLADELGVDPGPAPAATGGPGRASGRTRARPGSPCTTGSVLFISCARRQYAAGNRLWRWRTSDRAGARKSSNRLHRQRAVRRSR